jgi:hypothetical protein
MMKTRMIAIRSPQPRETTAPHPTNSDVMRRAAFRQADPSGSAGDTFIDASQVIVRFRPIALAT